MGTEPKDFAGLSETSRHFVCNTRPMAFGLTVMAKKFVKTVQSNFLKDKNPYGTANALQTESNKCRKW